MTSYKVKTIASEYTANGGQQPPNYFGTNTSGILMMNTTVNGNSQYKDWLIMDAYHGTDVGGGVAIGVNRQSLGAYIMRSAATRTAWAESAELLGTHNAYTYLDPRYVNITGDTMTGALNLKSDLNLYTSSADSPDITWWYADKGKEQARIWMGSGDTSTFAPKYRCYNSNGTQLYSGNLVLGNGTGASGTWSISISGGATYASSYLANHGTVSGSNHAEALKAYFNSNKASEPRNALVAHYSSASGNGSLCMGYFLSGYDTAPYGGFFVCHYDNPRYVGISNGTFTQHDLVTCDHAQNFTGTKSWGASGAGGQLNGAATNGGINSIRIGDDVWLGDCNAGGILGMKSTGANTGFYFYNSSGTQIGQFYSNGTVFNCNKPIYATANAMPLFKIERTDSAETSIYLKNATAGWAIGIHSWGVGAGVFAIGQYAGTGSSAWRFKIDNNGYCYAASRMYNAVWNDYAEYRKINDKTPGYAVNPFGNLTTQRLEAGARIISDTYGHSIGYMENDETLEPVALAGRVLAYPLHDKSYYEVGDAVCAAEGGKIDKMTREEIMMYPDRILGIVNEIPDYDIWEPSLEDGGREPVHTNGRIWIDIK